MELPTSDQFYAVLGEMNLSQVQHDTLLQAHQKSLLSFIGCKAEPNGDVSPDVYGQLFNSPVADVDFMDIPDGSRAPVVDLKIMRSVSHASAALYKVVLKLFLHLEAKHQNDVVFLGEKSDIEQLFDYVPNAKVLLLQNPSIAAIYGEA